MGITRVDKARNIQEEERNLKGVPARSLDS
jgi:hypothetical protein